MRFFVYMSDYIVPFLILTILVYGISMNVEVYHTFIEGAEKGFRTVLGIMPTLIGLMTAVGILRASGCLEFISEGLGVFTAKMGFPGELVPISIVKMFSSSAATGLLIDLYKEFGADSFVGRAASIAMSCTETIFYTMSVYFLSIKIKHTRYTLVGGFLATMAGLVASVVLAGMMGQ